MGAHWTNVYPNPDALELAGTLPGEEEAVHYNGLELVPLYDYEDQLVWHDTWELRLARTGQALLHIAAGGQEAALKWATRIADSAPWASLEERPSWFDPFVPDELRAFIRANPTTFSAPVYLTGLSVEDVLSPTLPSSNALSQDLDSLIPFGDQGATI